MAKQLQMRRGTTTEMSTFVGAEGEVTVDTTKDVIVVHDGATVGGFPVAARANADGTISLIKKDGTSAGTINAAGLLNNTLTSTNTDQALTAAQGKFLLDTMFGVGQTTVDVTSSRLINTTYTNSTSKPIFITISTFDLTGDTQIVLDGVSSGNIDSSLETNQLINFPVRVGGTYRLNTPVTSALNKWLELR